MRTFIRRIRSLLPHSTTWPSIMPFMPPPERYSKFSIGCTVHLFCSISSAKAFDMEQPEAIIIVPA